MENFPLFLCFCRLNNRLVNMCKVVFSGQLTQKQWIQTIRGRMTPQCADRSQDNET